MAVTWNYNGSNQLAATLSASTAGKNYKLFCNDNTSTEVTVVGTGSPIILTVTDIGGISTGDQFAGLVYSEDAGDVYDSNVFKHGSASTTGVGIAGVTWNWDGTTVTASFTSSVTDSYVLTVNFISSGSLDASTDTDSGTAVSLSVDPAGVISGATLVALIYDQSTPNFSSVATRVFVVASTGSGSAGSPTSGGTDTGVATPVDDTTVFSGPVRVGIGFSTTALDTNPTWVYITDGITRVASYSIDRGRQFEFDKTEAGTATVAVNDIDGTLDPTNSAGPYFGLLEPLLQIRIELWNPVTLQYFSRFRGWIEDYDYVVEPFTHQDGSGNTVGLTRLQINCVDIFEILTAIEMQPDGTFGDTPPTTPVDVSGNIFFDNAPAGSTVGPNRVDQVMGNAAIPTDFYVLFSLNVNMLESVYSPSENVLQVIQDAADAEFPTVANVYTDRFGRLAIHGRLAKFDPAGTAAGAAPGAWDFTNWKAGDGAAVALSPTDTAHIRTFAYNRGLSMIRNSTLCTPNGIDNPPSGGPGTSDIPGQYFKDDPSIGLYGIRSWSAENLFVDNGILTGNTGLEECLAFGTFIVNNYKTPRNRITDIEFKSIQPAVQGAAANWDLLCRVDVSDLVDVTIHGPGDTGLAYIFNAEPFFVEGVHEESTPANGDYANVTTTLDLSPQAYFSDDSGVNT